MNKKVEFNNYVADYNELLRKNTRFFSSNEGYFSQYKVELVTQNINHAVTRVLEYGCGIGRNIPFLNKHFPNAEIVGTDISVASLNAAATENSYAQFMVESSELDIGQFDLIFVAGVFHHVPINQRRSVAKTLSKRLSKTGTLFIFEHNPYNPLTRKIVKNCPYDEDAILIKPVEFSSIFAETTLKIQKQAYYLFVPPRFSQFAFIEKYFQRLPLGGQYWLNLIKER